VQLERQTKIFLVAGTLLASLIAVLLMTQYGAERIFAPRIVAPVLSISADELTHITISCRELNTLPWNRSVTQIDDRETTESITDGLHRALEGGWYHAQCARNCLVELRKVERTLAFEARWSCLHPESGALIDFWSNGDWGIYLGEYTSEDLEVALSYATAITRSSR